MQWVIQKFLPMSSSNYKPDNILLWINRKVSVSLWANKKGEWYFSIVNIVGILTDSKNPRKYWSDLKRKMKEEEGADQLYENIVQLKLKAPDGKMRETDVADMQGLFRIIQSIPSPKAEPFKMWLAEVGKERVDETIDPELTIDRALETYLKKGYTREWINQRLQAIQVRKELTTPGKTTAWQMEKDYGTALLVEGKRKKYLIQIIKVCLMNY